MLIANRQFSGERPKKSIRNVQTNEAEVALDCEILSDELRPIKTNLPTDVELVDGVQTIFNIEGTWLSFDQDVDVVRSPVGQSVTRIFWTGDGKPKQATVDEFQAGISYSLGVPRPPAIPVGTVSGDPDVEVSEVISSFLIFTFVNAYGEEGDRSAPSEGFTYQPGQTITMDSMTDALLEPLIAEHNVVAIRWYLFDPDADASRFVSEVPVTQPTDTVVTSGLFLGESFSTDDFDVPPPNLQGLHVMSNQVMLGFDGRTVYATEPGQPSAWRYFFPVTSNVVAISSYDNNAVILTEEYPEIATIFDPRNISTTVLADREPCVSTRSVVQGLGGVIYAAPSGTYFIGSSGGQMLTEDFYDEEDWQQVRPETLLGVFRDGEYIGFHRSLEKEGNAVVFDTREANAIVRQLSQKADAAFVLPGTDDLYVAVDGRLELVNGGSDDQVYFWRSKMHGGGSPFAITSRRLISCQFFDNLTAEERAAFEEFRDTVIADRQALIQERLAIGVIHGLGGALNQDTLGGCGLWAMPGVSTPQDQGVVIGGGAEGTIPRTPTEFFTDLTIYGDKDIVHTERITDVCVGRVKYTQRRRLWQYELRGNAELTQFDMAGSNTEMHNGS